uniref:Uncharacterized protein n=1 Tax=Accipiter nisus TaxID=211598 RepID=A0A8B9NNY4_9AVES
VSLNIQWQAQMSLSKNRFSEFPVKRKASACERIPVFYLAMHMKNYAFTPQSLQELLFKILLWLKELVDCFSQIRILLSICSIQLQDKLSEKDKELKTIKLDLELQERATEAKIAEKIAGTVGNINNTNACPQNVGNEGRSNCLQENGAENELSS